MPIKVPDNPPALKILAKEGVDLIAENAAQHQDIAHYACCFEFDAEKDAEIQFARLFGNSPLQIDMLLMTTAAIRRATPNLLTCADFIASLMMCVMTILMH